jgi:hypothetical protein
MVEGDKCPLKGYPLLTSGTNPASGLIEEEINLSGNFLRGIQDAMGGGAEQLCRKDDYPPFFDCLQMRQCWFVA